MCVCLCHMPHASAINNGLFFDLLHSVCRAAQLRLKPNGGWGEQQQLNGEHDITDAECFDSIRPRYGVICCGNAWRLEKFDVEFRSWSISVANCLLHLHINKFGELKQHTIAHCA